MAPRPFQSGLDTHYWTTASRIVRGTTGPGQAAV